MIMRSIIIACEICLLFLSGAGELYTIHRPPSPAAEETAVAVGIQQYSNSSSQLEPSQANSYYLVAQTDRDIVSWIYFPFFRWLVVGHICTYPVSCVVRCPACLVLLLPLSSSRICSLLFCSLLLCSVPPRALQGRMVRRTKGVFISLLIVCSSQVGLSVWCKIVIFCVLLTMFATCDCCTDCCMRTCCCCRAAAAVDCILPFVFLPFFTACFLFFVAACCCCLLL